MFVPQSNQKYIYHSFRVYNPILCVYDAGITYSDGNYFREYDKIDSNLFEYIIAGKGYLKTKDKTYTLSAGDCVFISKDEYVSYVSDKYEPYTKLWFTTDGAYTGKLLEALGVPSGIYVKKNNLYSLFERFFHSLENEEFTIENAAEHIQRIMFALFYKDSSGESKNMSIAEQIKFYIDTLWQDNISLSDIATRFDISERTCMRYFVKEYGRSPYSYIKECRLEAARQMLIGTNYTVTVISELLHFCDQSYFSTEFRKEYGVYPTEYRHNYRRETQWFTPDGKAPPSQRRIAEKNANSGKNDFESKERHGKSNEQ